MKRSALSGVALLAVAGVVASLATLGAQAPEAGLLEAESTNLKVILLFGWKMPKAGVSGVPSELRPAVARYRQRQARFRSRLSPPVHQDWAFQVSFEKRVSFERTLWSLFDAPGIAEAAADFTRSTPLPYEWEGYPENPLAEATGADEYLARQPASPIAPYLHLFIAHRQYCAATLLPPSSPERRRALARFRSEVGIARQARHPLIRFVATDLAMRPDCWTDL
jgi:hypothetical protein